MKKFLTISITIVVCAVIWMVISDQYSLYINLDKGDGIEYSFRIKDKEIYRMTGGEWEEFEIRGVNLESFLPGHFDTDFAVEKEQYLEWFQLICEMGANTIRIPTILNNVFYDALYSFNRERLEKMEEPLYLIQALWVTDYAQDSGRDAYSDEFAGQLITDVKNAIDVIHGKKLLVFAKTRGSGWYTRDISEWVLGITLGTTWKGETIAYTNHMRTYAPYEGSYFSASADASQFECMLAETLDELMRYESRKYETQHLVSVINEPTTDPFDYEHNIKVQMGKYARIDTEHIIASDQVASGFYVSYKLYDFCPQILEYLTEEENKRLGHLLDGIDKEGPYDGYLELLEAYYSVPVVIADCGFSTARGITKKTGDHYGMTEKEQGEALVELYTDCREVGFSGMVISSWQDNWSRTDWNVYPMIDKERAPFWHNVQSESQGYGLLAFESQESASKVIIDGNPTEWKEEETLISNESGKIYCRQDESYLYIMAEWAEEMEHESLYIPIDVTPKSGSTGCVFLSAEFERAADFLLCLNGKTDARLLVQAYYDPWRAVWRQMIEHMDAYSLSVPSPSVDDFIAMRMVLKDDPELSEDWHKKNAEVFDTGLLCYGIGDPSHPQYNSRADFYTVGNCTELRIPWQLLNFSDPSQKTVHDDYYEHYGVEGQRIREIYLGLGSEKQKQQKITFGKLTLKSWGRNVKYHQRLKQSYDVVQDCWGK